MFKRLLIAAALLLAGACSAFAQTTTGNEFQTSATGKTVVGVVGMCLNASGVAGPCGWAGAAGAIATGQITVAATATQVVPARAGRTDLKIINGATTDVFCGLAGVTAATGVLLAGAKGQSISIPTSAAVFCIVASATEAVSFLEAYSP